LSSLFLVLAIIHVVLTHIQVLTGIDSNTTKQEGEH